MANANAAVADYVFARMASMFGHTWTSAYGEDSRAAPGREWAQALAGLSRQQVDEGFRATLIAGEKWPPSAPMFLERCLGVPTLAVVSHDILKGGDLTAFSRAVWLDLDTFCWRQAGTDRADRMLREAYERVKARVMAGEVLPPEPVASIAKENREFKPATPQQVERHVANIRAMLGVWP
jgi:hypothetical protein